jgi:hypothetical protein
MEAPMSDLIIHDVPESLRQQLDDVARASGRSPSEEAITMLAEALAKRPPSLETAKPGNAWDVLRAAIGEDNLLTEEEHAEFMQAIEEGRRTPDRLTETFK